MTRPALGFGCSPYQPGGGRADLEPAIREALAAGYRMLDGAEMYGNERAMGRALRSSGVPRAEVVIIGKAWHTSFEPRHLEAACAASLVRLGIDAFDLYLLHAPEAWPHRGPLADVEEIGWPELRKRAFGDERPTPGVPLSETWAAMERLRERGLARAIGVSNFTPADLERLGGAPAANQIAHDPFDRQPSTAAACAERGIALQAHSPLSRPGLLANPRLGALARGAGCTVAQLVLRWNLARGATPIVTSRNPAHLAENLAAVELVLDDATVAAIDRLHGSAP